MRKTTVFRIVDKNDNVIGIKVKTQDETFTIPVADVRRDRKKVEQIEKASNIAKGSKFMKPSYSVMGYSYNTSRK